ncbi:MAG: alpha/beta fold hydrolase [Aureispira sp.]
MKTPPSQRLLSLIGQLILIITSLSYATLAQPPSNPSERISFKSGYIQVNGVRLFYKETGKGTPMLFLHGGFGTSDLHFQHQFEAFANKYRIITLETRGHGKSTFNHKKFSYELFAEDTYAVLEALGVDSALVIGFSDGGITGLVLAEQHPEKVKNLVIIGSNSVPDSTAVYPSDIEWVQNMDIAQTATELQATFPNCPAPQKLPTFVKKMQKLWLNEPNLMDKDLQKISCPVLIIAGENDIIKIEHQVYLHRTIPNSHLLILPHTGHDAHITRKNIVNQFILELIEE